VSRFTLQTVNTFTLVIIQRIVGVVVSGRTHFATYRLRGHKALSTLYWIDFNR
jgi:hypothetical protein